MNKSELKPALVFEQFAKINEIPRPSKHEENMIEFLKSFGESHQLETLVDETGNVLIRKAATPGYEHAETIILQSHMDMVCDKLVDVDFDFHKDAIQTYVDGEWLKAVPGVKRGVQAGGLGGKTGENRIRQRGCADHDADGEIDTAQCCEICHAGCLRNGNRDGGRKARMV